MSSLPTLPRLEGVFGAVAQLPERVKARIEDKCASHGLTYPWWIPVGSTLGGIALVLVAVAQRDAVLPLRPVALAALLVILPPLAQVILKRWVPWWIEAGSTLAGVGWLLAVPLGTPGPADVAPMVLIVLAAEITATEGAVVGTVVTAAGCGVIAAVATVGNVPGVVLYIVGVMLGLDVGYMTRWQMRALAAERAAREGERVQATLAERQRIAREIHDVVAHSLSVTLLHVTGARRALQEDEDVPEAIDALRDAERIGREAMTDIRRTVSVLGTEPSGSRPLPSADDIEALVSGIRSAGLDVAYDTDGDINRLGHTAGLALYRIAQESLANVAKHAPASTVQLSLRVTAETARLTARNALPRSGARAHEGGLGLPGMAARAAQLGGSVRAGPDGANWVVDCVLPVESVIAATPERHDPACLDRWVTR